MDTKLCQAEVVGCALEATRVHGLPATVHRDGLIAVTPSKWLRAVALLLLTLVCTENLAVLCCCICTFLSSPSIVSSLTSNIVQLTHIYAPFVCCCIHHHLVHPQKRLCNISRNHRQEKPDHIHLQSAGDKHELATAGPERLIPTTYHQYLTRKSALCLGSNIDIISDNVLDKVQNQGSSARLVLTPSRLDQYTQWQIILSYISKATA